MTSAVERKRLRRPGVKPRAEYEDNSINRSRPWVAERMSRTSWYRLRRHIDWHRHSNLASIEAE
jgi:hypothetical protein